MNFLTYYSSYRLTGTCSELVLKSARTLNSISSVVGELRTLWNHGIPGALQQRPALT